MALAPEHPDLLEGAYGVRMRQLELGGCGHLIAL
jgi:hypothetical protein